MVPYTQTKAGLTLRMAVIRKHGGDGRSFWILWMGLSKTIHPSITMASILEVSIEYYRKLKALSRDPYRIWGRNQSENRLGCCFVCLVTVSASFLPAIAIYIQSHRLHRCTERASEWFRNQNFSPLLGKIYKIVEGNSGEKADLSRGRGEVLLCSS